MKTQKSKRQKAIIRRRIFISCCLLMLVGIIGIAVVAWNLIGGTIKTPSASSSDSVSDNSASPEDKITKTGSATIVSTGDILVHNPQLWGAYNKTADSYDFSNFFAKVSPFFKQSDLAVANLEITFGGTQSGKYSGYPAFNTPDSLADAIKTSGLSLLLTANNHCYDTGLFGLKRTVQVLGQRDLSFVGTRESSNDPAYSVKEINGIKIGIACYTYENTCDIAGRKSINGNTISQEANDLINSFSYEHIDDFYTSAGQAISAMKNDGADCVVFYMHWGQEYQLTENTWQRTIAQKLCNLGVDVIIGGHPHVVQPMALLHAEDSENTTVCLYSMGNAISNQRQEILTQESPNGNTEDGVLFYCTFDRYSDGTVVLASVDLIPTWTNKYAGGAGYLYEIVPLENPGDGAAKYGLTGTAAQKSQASYERTKATVAAGLTECQTFLGSAVRFDTAAQ